MRIDVWLVENGFAPSRQKAQELIAAGRVKIADTVVKKPSFAVTYAAASQIRVEANDGPEFVSRGGNKLFGVAGKTGVSFVGKSVLDVGISTGGFTDCALQLGAKHIVGIDVGHGQLAAKLKGDPRVVLFEGVNARELGAAPGNSGELATQILTANGGRKFDILVIDVSFISLKMVLPAVVGFLRESGQVLALVKPQFEVGREGIGRGGLVKDATLYPGVETSIRDVCASLGLRVESYLDSPILGSDGNREFFIHATVPQLGLF